MSSVALVLASLALSACGDDASVTGSGGGGASSSTSEAATTSSSGSGGSGAGSACSSSDECDDANPCTLDTCDDGACAHSVVEQELADDTPGDCMRPACDDGAVVRIDASADVPVVAVPCLVGACGEGGPTTLPEALDTPCGTGLFCDGEGACVGCVDDDECVGPSACVVGTCNQGACAYETLPEGEVVTPPVDDPCATYACVAGVVERTPTPYVACPAGACDGEGMCRTRQPASWVACGDEAFDLLPSPRERHVLARPASAFSGDGTRLLGRNGLGIELLDVSATPPLRLLTVSASNATAVSANSDGSVFHFIPASSGSRIAFAASQNVHSLPGTLFSEPRWSSNGLWMAYRTSSGDDVLVRLVEPPVATTYQLANAVFAVPRFLADGSSALVRYQHALASGGTEIRAYQIPLHGGVAGMARDLGVDVVPGPSGNVVAYAANSTGGHGIYLAQLTENGLEGEVLRASVANYRDVKNLTWRPSGTHLHFDMGFVDVYEVPVAQGAARVIESATTFAGNGLAVSADSRWLYYVGASGALRAADLLAPPATQLHTISPGFATSMNGTVSIGSHRMSPSGMASLTRAGGSAQQNPWMFHWMGGTQPVTLAHEMASNTGPSFHERGGVLRLLKAQGGTSWIADVVSGVPAAWQQLSAVNAQCIPQP
jgi:hypothetical protein